MEVITVAESWRFVQRVQRRRGSVIPCVVLDPFGGSGTTGQVARDAGCHAILCELNPEYVELIEQRLAQGSLLV